MKEHEQSCVLFVDDEKNLLKAIQRLFYNQPFHSFYADSTQKAFEILDNNNICVLVSDLTMPGIGGLKFLRLVNEKYPEIIRIVLTGQSKIPLTLKANNEGPIFKYIVKPWPSDVDFIKIVHDAIEHYYWKKKKLEETQAAKAQEELEYIQNPIGNNDTEKETDIQKLTKRLVALQSMNKKLADFILSDVETYLQSSTEIINELTPNDSQNDKIKFLHQHLHKINKIIQEIKNIYSRNV